MIEKSILLEGCDPAVFYGVNHAHILLLRSLFPKIRLAARGSVLRVQGEDKEIAAFETLVTRLVAYATHYNQLSEEVIRQILHGEITQADAAHSGDVIVYGIGGKAIQAKTPHGQALVTDFAHHDLCFAIGPAGTGKTYMAIALAVRALKEKAVKRIILSRPAVEAGEKLGFLPGEMKDKLDPYLQPLYDALGDMLPAARLQEYIETGVIQIAPLAFMRGRTLSEAIVILDEAQNTTSAQLKMFLTRLGMGSRMIVTGDLSQVDLPRGVVSGLRVAERVLAEVEGVSFVYFDRSDTVRHRLVERIVAAYERDETRPSRSAE